jgi:hypothetical protein
VSVLPPIGAPDDESPGTMFVMLHVTDVGVPAATVTVPPVKVFAPLAPLALKSPKVTPPASVAAAPAVATQPAIMASRFFFFFDIFILTPG